MRPGADVDDMLAVARLGRAHGLRGEVRTLSLSPPVLDFAELVLGRKLWTRGAKPGSGVNRTLTPVALRPHQGEFLIEFEEITDRTAAEEARGVELCLPREDLPALPEGWYWEEDLIGLEVRDETLGPLGVSTGLSAAAGQDSLVVRLSDPRKGKIQIPWAKALVPQVDLEARVIITRLPQGFPGLSEEPEA